MASLEKKMLTLHRKMYNFYNSKINIAKDRQDAQILEQFFQKIKKASKSTVYDESAAGQAREKLKERFQKIKFGAYSGVRFETEIAQVEAVVAELVTGTQVNRDIVKALKTGTNPVPKITVEDKSILEFLKQLGVKYSKKIQAPKIGGGQIKMDVAGLSSLNLEFVPNQLNEELNQVFQILQNSSFSVKSYASINEYYGAYEKLSLGRTKISTILYYLLPPVMGWQWKQYLGLLSLNQDNLQVQLHVQHLKQIYELSGIGQGGKGSAKGVRFFIYNDPSGEALYVKAVSEMVNQILNQKTVTGNPFDNDIYTLLSRDLSELAFSTSFERIT